MVRRTEPELAGILDDVSCVSAKSCTAAGATGNLTVIESWNGTAWSLVKSPNRPTQDQLNSNELDGVSCVTTTSCQTVGIWSQEGFPETLVEAYG